jgi:hypothetical protein
LFKVAPEQNVAKVSKIGVYLPTHCNPLFLRLAILQLMAQRTRPAVIAIHENNHECSYLWAARDVLEIVANSGVEIIHDFTPARLEEPEFYRVPLMRLIESNCEVFFKFDDDDFFYADHIEHGVEQLQGFDYTINRLAEVLVLPYRGKYVHIPAAPFDLNPTGCMSDSVCFNRRLAIAYEKALRSAQSGTPDDVVMNAVQKGFRGNIVVERATTCYVTHGANISTAGWAEKERLRQRRDRRKPARAADSVAATES